MPLRGYGLPAQSRIPTFADSLLDDMRNRDAGVGGEALGKLPKSGSAKVGREVERGVVDVETLQTVNARLVAAGGVGADRHELGVDEPLHHAAHIGTVLARQHADTRLQTAEERPLADAGHDDRVHHVLSESEHRREAAAVPVRGVADHRDGVDVAVHQVDEREVRRAPEVPRACRVKAARRLGGHGQADAVF
jgi:hypothetical protein